MKPDENEEKVELWLQVYDACDDEEELLLGLKEVVSDSTGSRLMGLCEEVRVVKLQAEEACGLGEEEKVIEEEKFEVEEATGSGETDEEALPVPYL